MRLRFQFTTYCWPITSVFSLRRAVELHVGVICSSCCSSIALATICGQAGDHTGCHRWPHQLLPVPHRLLPVATPAATGGHTSSLCVLFKYNNRRCARNDALCVFPTQNWALGRGMARCVYSLHKIWRSGARNGALCVFDTQNLALWRVAALCVFPTQNSALWRVASLCVFPTQNWALWRVAARR